MCLFYEAYETSQKTMTNLVKFREKSVPLLHENAHYSKHADSEYLNAFYGNKHYNRNTKITVTNQTDVSIIL